jgi:hypothetical protein
MAEAKLLNMEKNGVQLGQYVESTSSLTVPSQSQRYSNVVFYLPAGVETTGRQLRPLSSVLYRIISKRRYILAAQLLLREKSGT